MSFRAEIGFGLLLLAALTAAVLLGGPRRSGGTDPRTSTLVSSPSGSQAIYDVLIRLGQPVERRRTALFNLMDDSLRRPLPGTLVVVAPRQPLLPAEVDQVVAFVQTGRSVVAVGNGGGITRCAGWEAPYVEDRPLPDSVPVIPPSGDLTLPRVRRILRRLESADDKKVVLEARNCGELIPAAQDTVLRLADRRPVILELQYAGGGRILLAADPDYFRNRAWRQSDAPRLLVPLLLSGPRGRISWDEYHQGFGVQASSTGAMFNWLLRSPVGWALLQLTAVALVWLAVTAVRFGPARAVIERRRRSPLEHVEALAAGLESGGGADTAVALNIGGLRRRLHRSGVGGGEERRWLSSLELALPTARGRAAVRRLQHLSTHPGGDERVLDAARAVEDVWEEFRPRTARD